MNYDGRQEPNFIPDDSILPDEALWLDALASSIDELVDKTLEEDNRPGRNDESQNLFGEDGELAPTILRETLWINQSEKLLPKTTPLHLRISWVERGNLCNQVRKNPKDYSYKGDAALYLESLDRKFILVHRLATGKNTEVLWPAIEKVWPLNIEFPEAAFETFLTDLERLLLWQQLYETDNMTQSEYSEWRTDVVKTTEHLIRLLLKSRTNWFFDFLNRHASTSSFLAMLPDPVSKKDDNGTEEESIEEELYKFNPKGMPVYSGRRFTPAWPKGMRMEELLTDYLGFLGTYDDQGIVKSPGTKNARIKRLVEEMNTMISREIGDRVERINLLRILVRAIFPNAENDIEHDTFRSWVK